MRTYKSTDQRLVYLFRKSRDRWQQRSAEKQAKLRAQAIRIRDLEASRELWKQRAQAAEQSLKVLETQILEPASQKKNR